MNKKIAIFGLALSLFCNAYSSEIREVEMLEEMFEQESKTETVIISEEEFSQEKEREQEVEISKELEVLKEEIEKEEIFPREEVIPKEITEEQEKEDVQEEVKKEEKLSEIQEETFLAAIVGDRKGNIYYQKNADKSLPMASVTKVMTLLVTFDAIRNGKASFQDKITITKDVYRKGGSGISMKPGEVFTLLDLIRATAIYSANNAAYAVAKHIGKGSISNFVKKMNQKAKQIGIAKEISYYTPAGLPTRYTKEPMDVGTARGIYKLSLYALKYPEYMEIAGIKQMKIHNGKISIRNRNHLIGEQGIYGIKTGYHKEAKYNITVASKEGKKEYIVVVLGGKTYQERDRAVLDLLNQVKNK